MDIKSVCPLQNNIFLNSSPTRGVMVVSSIASLISKKDRNRMKEAVEFYRENIFESLQKFY